MGSKEGPMAPKNEPPTISSSDKAYVLPSWFLEQHVKTSQDLATIPDQMVFCNCNDCEKTKLADEELEGAKLRGNKLSGVDEKNEPGHAPDEMHYKTFSELRDVICASLMPLWNGNLRKESTIVFRMQGKYTSFLEPAWMSRAVVQVAKASKGMSIISFDLETLEELGCEFHQQDKQKAEEQTSAKTYWEPDMKSFTTFLGRFFAIDPKRSARRKEWQRNQQALSTIFDAAKVQQTAACSKMGERDGSDSILIHIMDCSLVGQALENRTKRRVLGRIAGMVRARREQGEAMAILLSTKDYHYKPGCPDFDEIGATEGSTVTASRDKILDWDQRNQVRTGIVNAQRMRRLMRYRLPSDLFCSELTTVNSEWVCTSLTRTYKSFGKDLWSSGALEKAITLLMGRGLRLSKTRPQLSFRDVCAVLEHLNMFYQAESEPGQEAAVEAGESHIASTTKFATVSNAQNYAYRKRFSR